MPSKADALRQLSYRQATNEHHKAYEAQVTSETNDRGACLLLASNLENALDIALQSAVFGTNETRRDLFEQDGPLATFARKCSMAYALRIVGPTTHANLRIIRLVRNAFAHSKIPIEFTTPEVAAMCDDLVLINPVDPTRSREHERGALSPRLVFGDVCASTSWLLYAWSLGPIMQFDYHDLKPDLGSFPEYDLYLMRKTLP